MVARGIFAAKGSADTFRPDDCVTRGECVRTALNLFGLSETASDQVFRDVGPDNPYFGAISSAYHLGLIQGYPDGSFQPDAFITRQDAEVILYRGIVNCFPLDPDQIECRAVGEPLSIRDWDEIAPYARDAVSLCFEYYINMFKNDHCANPLDIMTRCGLASEFYRCLRFLNCNL
jgi:hypothetical protein